MLNQNQQIFEQIKKAKDILITFGKTRNGDAVASALGLYLFLKKINKNVDIIAEEFQSGEAFSFLPGFSDIKTKIENLRKFIITLDTSSAKINQIKYKIEDSSLNFIISMQDGNFSKDDISSHYNNFKYDLIMIVDTPDLESLGKIYDDNTDLFYKIPVINIDHHPVNEEFGQINLIDLTAVATSEIIFSLLRGDYTNYIDEDIATCLLAGIIAETRSFKVTNISPQTLSNSAQLVSLGARREDIVNRLYRSRSLKTLKIWGRALSRLQSSLDDGLIWTAITHLDFVKTGSKESDLNEIIDELILTMPKVKAIAIFYETVKNDKIISNCLFYANKGLSALDILKEYNPGGTKHLAQISLFKPMQEFEKEVISLIENKLKNLI
ncbi:MAG: DHH family phosphoesterase [Patescibacteria group bacterium]